MICHLQSFRSRCGQRRNSRRHPGRISSLAGIRTACHRRTPPFPPPPTVYGQAVIWTRERLE